MIGVRISNLTTNKQTQISLFDENEEQDNKVDNIVQNAIRQYARRTYTIEMMPNREQNIYFYKII